MAKFKKLVLTNWRQFENVSINVHPRLTILTGANGAGKSTILSIFSQHFGWNRNVLATPRTLTSGARTFFQGVFKTLKVSITRGDASNDEIGFVEYDNNLKATLTVPKTTGIQYGISINAQQAVEGFHISSHRSIPIYQGVGTIPTNFISPQLAYSNYSSELQTEFASGRWSSSPIFRMKEALISMAMFGEGNKHIQPNPEIQTAFNGFISKLIEVLPEAIGFVGLDIRMPDVVLRTKTGDFLLDASSGGLMALIDITWRIYMNSLNEGEFVVTFDEPENHLHPSMQQSLLPNLIKAFPRVQFIVVTHSPFVVSSVKDSNVYVLRHRTISENANDAETGGLLTQERAVNSQQLDTLNKAGNAAAILRDVLGVPTTLPQWLDEDIDVIVKEYSIKEFSKDTLIKLRLVLKERGLDEFYPQVVSQISSIHDQTH